MTTEQTTAPVKPRDLAVGDFTASDLARIALGKELLHTARVVEGMVLMLCADDAVAGDYAAQAVGVRNAATHAVLRAAVIAERARGTSWERIGEMLSVSAERAEADWGKDVRKWESQTKAQSLLHRDPAVYLDPVDAYAATGQAGNPREGRPSLRRVLDAAAQLTGRDVAAADGAFAGAEVCSHCHR